MTVQVTELSNGIRVVSEYRRSLQTVAIGVWVDVGARYESALENGHSHFLEHMLFKGTDRRGARAIAEEIENVGGHMNAYTSRDHTTFYARVMKDDWPLALDVLSDIIQNSKFDADELHREKDVIVQEIGQSIDTPDDIVFDRLQEQAFPDQPIGRPILGSEETVRGVSRNGLMDYMKRHYQAGRTVISAAGYIDHDALVREVEAKFCDLQAGCGETFQPAVYEGGFHHLKDDLEQNHVVLGFPGLPFSHPDYYALQVFSTVMGGGMSSRLFQEVREKHGLAYSVYSFAASHIDTGMFGIYAGTAPEMTDGMLRVIAGEMHEIASSATGTEVERAKAQLKAGLMMLLENTASRSEQLGRQMLLFGRPIPIAETIERVEEVDVKAVSRVAQYVLSAGRLSAASVGNGSPLDEEKVSGLFKPE